VVVALQILEESLGNTGETIPGLERKKEFFCCCWWCWLCEKRKKKASYVKKALNFLRLVR